MLRYYAIDFRHYAFSYADAFIAIPLCHADAMPLLFITLSPLIASPFLRHFAIFAITPPPLMPLLRRLPLLLFAISIFCFHFIAIISFFRLFSLSFRHFLLLSFFFDDAIAAYADIADAALFR